MKYYKKWTKRSVRAAIFAVEEMLKEEWLETPSGFDLDDMTRALARLKDKLEKWGRP